MFKFTGLSTLSITISHCVLTLKIQVKLLTYSSSTISDRLNIIYDFGYPSLVRLGLANPPATHILSKNATRSSNSKELAYLIDTQGFRIANYTDEIYVAFDETRKEQGITGKFEIPMQFFTRMVEYLLSEYGGDGQQVASLTRRHLKKCYFFFRI